MRCGTVKADICFERDMAEAVGPHETANGVDIGIVPVGAGTARPPPL